MMRFSRNDAARMTSSTREERLQIMLTPEELSAIDDYRFKQRLPSRAAAIRDLLRLGLASHGTEIATPKRKSESFGVLEQDPDKA